MIVFPDSNVETEYTDPNGSVWEFNGTGWVRQCESSGGGSGSGGSGGNYGDLYSSLTLDYQAIKSASGGAISEANDFTLSIAVNVNETNAVITNHNRIVWVKHDGTAVTSVSELNPPLVNQPDQATVQDRFAVVGDEVYFIYKVNGFYQMLTKLSYNGGIQRTDIGSQLSLGDSEGDWSDSKVRLFNISNSPKNSTPMHWLFHSDNETAPLTSIRLGQGPNYRPMVKVTDIDLSANITNTYFSNELDGAVTPEGKLLMAAGIARDPANQYGFVINVVYNPESTGSLYHGAFYVDISKGTVQERYWGTGSGEKKLADFDAVTGLAHFSDKNTIGMLLSYKHESGAGMWAPSAYAIKLPEDRDAFSSDAVIQNTNADSFYASTQVTEANLLAGSATVMGSYEVTGQAFQSGEPPVIALYPSKVGGYLNVDPIDAYSHDNTTSGGRMIASLATDDVSLIVKRYGDQSSAQVSFVRTLSCPARTKDPSNSFKYVHHLGRGMGDYSFVLHRDRSSPYAGKIKLIPWYPTDAFRAKVAVSGGVATSGIIDSEDAAYAVSDDLWPVYSKCPRLLENQKYSEEYELTVDDELRRVYIFREAVDMTPEEIEQSLTTED